jgi:hypothetical protein
MNMLEFEGFLLVAPKRAPLQQERALTMNMPGFTAEASLDNPKERYRLARPFSDGGAQGSVIPSKPKGGNYADDCDSIAFACDILGGSFCTLYKSFCA